MTPTIAFPERNFGLRKRQKYPGRAGNICHVADLLLVEALQQPWLFPIMGIHPYPAKGKSLFFERKNHLQAQLGLCLKGDLGGHPTLLLPFLVLYPGLRKIETAIH